MFRVIKDENFGARRFRRKKLRILRHVSSAIHFALMIHFYFDLNLAGYRAKAAEFCRKKCACFRKMHNSKPAYRLCLYRTLMRQIAHLLTAA